MMSAAVTSAGARLRASRNRSPRSGWRTLTCPNPSTTPWSNRIWFAATSSSITPAAISDVGTAASGVELDVHVFDLRGVLQFFDRLFAAHARLLVTAKRGTEVMRARRVDPYVAGFDERGGTMRGGKIARPDRSGQPVLDVIDRPQHLGFVRPSKHAEHRAEDFLARNPHLVRDVGENGR